MRKIKQLIQSFMDSKKQTVYIQDEYCIRCRESSRDTSYSYFYEYTKPCLIETADKKSIPLDEILKFQEEGESLIHGVRAESHDSYSEAGVRTREYVLYITREACPLKIKYSSGSGEGYSDSEYWASERKEYWITYV